ncbi:hypothetical protein H6B07_11585 [Mediterraneibacter glycyrrhizinilyticus]|nr:hypothetical protein [Mediterraneibacter glycyrrhizinilyticus]MBM6803286.1 hypothetical protein [Mediterraneibacter glycyrrhizinilyticus]
MSAIKLQKGTEEFEMFRDYWKMLEENWGVEDSEAYWNKVIEDTDAFYRKYDTEFSKELALALINELERKEKDEKKL